jgi:hypothetical protein
MEQTRKFIKQYFRAINQSPVLGKAECKSRKLNGNIL